MSSVRRSIGCVVVAGFVAAACAPPTPSPSPATVRVDVSSAEVPADDGSGYVDGYLTQSGDGRFVLFSSVATNLVPDDTNAGQPFTLDGLDLFVRDRAAGTTSRVSMQPDGSEFPAGVSDAQIFPMAAITRDGRYVVFAVTEANGVDWTVYRHDRSAGTTQLFAAVAGSQVFRSGPLDVSDDATLVSFPGISMANTGRNAYVLTLGNPVPQLVGTAENSNPRLSAAGRYVAADGYRHDRVTSTTEPIVAAGPAGTDVVLAMSGSGRYVAFSSSRPGLTPDDTNAVDDLFVADMSTSSVTLVSTGGGVDGIVPSGGWALNTFPGTPPTINARYPLASISDDGNRVGFITDATDVVAGPATTGWNTYVRTLSTSSVVRITADHDVSPRWQTWGGRFLSSDGTRVVVQGRRSGVAGTWSHPVA